MKASTTTPHRRRLLLGLAGLAGLGAARPLASLAAGDAAAEAPAREIEVVAQRFRYTPAEIPLKVGERVVVVFHSLDFVHGLNVPQLGVRLDLLPGRPNRLALQPQAAGTIAFLCDNFCGDGHETMHGRFVVSA